MQKLPYILGLDLGTDSIGWACINIEQERIVDAGVRIFDAAENPKTGESLAKPRRDARLARRRLFRRVSRLKKTAQLLQNFGFISDFAEVQNPSIENLWQLRVQALDRALSNNEISKIIYHISKARGFKSSKKELNNTEDKELTKANKDMQVIEEAFTESKMRTIAEFMVVNYGNTDKNIRNKLGSYTHLIKQDLNEKELSLILKRQKEFGNTLITDEFTQKLFDIFLYRKGLPSFEEKVAACELENDCETLTQNINKNAFLIRRAPKDAISSLLFRLWQDLNNFSYQIDTDSPKLCVSLEKRRELIEKAFTQKSFSESSLVKFLGLAKREYITEHGEVKNSDKYLCTIEPKKLAKALSFKSYHELKEVLISLNVWEQVKDNYKALDAIVYVVAYLKEYKNFELLQDIEIEEIIHSLSWDNKIWEDIFNSLSFDRTMGHSLQAMWKLLPHFEKYDETAKPLTYDKIINLVYVDKFNSRATKNSKFVPKFDEANITSPVVKRSLNQTRLLINKLIATYGKPEQINIELARDLGKSFQDRKELTKQQEKNRDNNQITRDACTENSIKNPLMYRLWKEQAEQCMYTGKSIGIVDLQVNNVEIDHILPLSRSGDDSNLNKVLVLSIENQHKGNLTAHEFLSSKGAKHLEEFKVRVQNSRLAFKKKERLLLEDFSEQKSQDYKTRHLNDSRYIARELKNHLDKTIRPAGQDYNYVQTIAGRGTATLRKLWHMGDKNREESHKHHALDAMLIAGAGLSIKKWERMVTTASQYGYAGDEPKDRITKNMQRFGFDIAPPWEKFSHDARYYIENHIFVSRLGKRKVIGAMHKETIKSRRADGTVVKSVILGNLGKKEAEVLKSLSKMVDKDGRNKKLYDIIVQHAELFDWNMPEAFNAENAPHIPSTNPASTHIPQIRKIKITDSASSKLILDKMSSETRKACVDSGSVIRLDLFKDSKDKYYLVPVYAFHYKELPEPTDPNSVFQFSIYKNDYLVLKSDKAFANCSENPLDRKKVLSFGGYWNTYRTSIQTAFVSHDTNTKYSITISNLKSIEKYRVDILGNKHLLVIPEERLSLQEVAKKWGRKG